VKLICKSKAKPDIPVIRRGFAKTLGIVQTGPSHPKQDEWSRRKEPDESCPWKRRLFRCGTSWTFFMNI